MTISYNSSNKITNTGILFYGKRLYYSTVISQYPGMFIDLWYNKPLYGKVDRDFNIIGAPATNLKIVNDGRNREDVYALDFVADAFNAMGTYLQQLELNGKVRPGSFFYPLKAFKGWQGIDEYYRAHLQSLYNNFLNSYVLGNNEKINREVRSFDSYLPKFIDYLNLITGDASVPLTRTGLISKADIPHRISGLVIEIADEKDFSDDPKKFRSYFSESQFDAFINVATKFGFYVDMNAPWRLVANLESPAWRQNPILKKIVDSYFENGYTLNKVFEERFYKTYTDDLESLKVLTLQFYNSLVAEIETIEIPNGRINCLAPSSLSGTYQTTNFEVFKIHRLPITRRTFDAEYDSLFWLRIYMQLRIREMGIAFTKNQMKFDMREIEQKYRTQGEEGAMLYIAGRLAELLRDQMSEFKTLRNSRKNLLTTGKAPDIIL
tara:strand:- start:378 stop:1685 length:1308 start_codon:yes stop_codon:yes gene_type:complete